MKKIEKNGKIFKFRTKIADFSLIFDFLQYWRVAEGSGKIYGMEMNKKLFEKAEKFCSLEISEEKVEIHFGIPSHMPFLENYFDRVFHCNAFYFWPNLDLTVAEIFRVMKPGALP